MQIHESREFERIREWLPASGWAELDRLAELHVDPRLWSAVAARLPEARKPSMAFIRAIVERLGCPDRGVERKGFVVWLVRRCCPECGYTAGYPVPCSCREDLYCRSCGAAYWRDIVGGDEYRTGYGTPDGSQVDLAIVNEPVPEVERIFKKAPRMPRGPRMKATRKVAAGQS